MMSKRRSFFPKAPSNSKAPARSSSSAATDSKPLPRSLTSCLHCTPALRLRRFAKKPESSWNPCRTRELWTTDALEPARPHRRDHASLSAALRLLLESTADGVGQVGTLYRSLAECFFRSCPDGHAPSSLDWWRTARASRPHATDCRRPFRRP